MSSSHSKILGLLDRSGHNLFALLTRLTLREDVAEDLMQELFVKLSDAENRTRIDNWDAYARRTAINLAFDWRRREKHNPIPLDEYHEQPSNDDSPLAGLIQAEQMEEILGAIGKLNGTSREAFVMRYIQQDSYDDIAGQLGKTSHQVRALCSKAMGGVRDLVGSNHSPFGGKGVQRVEN